MVRPGERQASTAVQRQLAWDRYSAWCMGLRRPTLDPQAVRDYIASMLQRQCVPTYCKTEASHITMALRRLQELPDDHPFPVLQQLQRQLDSLLPFHTNKQATPAQVPQVLALFQADPQRLGLLVAALHFAHARAEMWLRLARSRLRFLVTEHASHGTEFWLTVAYGLTKTVSRGIVKTALVPVPRWLWTLLRVRARHCPPQLALFHDVSQHQLEAFIRPLGLSLHSFRRGAIQRSLDAGVLEEELCRLTTHANVTSLLDYADRVPSTAFGPMRRALAAQLGSNRLPNGEERPSTVFLE